MKRRYIVTDLLRLIYFFIYELVIIQIFCKTKFSECSAREREKVVSQQIGRKKHDAFERICYNYVIEIKDTRAFKEHPMSRF